MVVVILLLLLLLSGSRLAVCIMYRPVCQSFVSFFSRLVSFSFFFPFQLSSFSSRFLDFSISRRFRCRPDKRYPATADKACSGISSMLPYACITFMPFHPPFYP